MKIILYVTMYTFLWSTSSRADSTDPDNKYDLLENMQLERTASGFLKMTAWDFRNLQSPYALTLSNNITLRRPYAINIVFKLYEVKSWCIFSIVNPEGKTKLSVCITPVTKKDVRISIEGLTEKDIEFFHEMEVKDNWMTIQIFVNNNSVTHRVNCLENFDKVDIPEKDVILSTEDQVLIGQSNSVSNSGSFQGIIEEITIYSPSDDSTLDIICGQTKNVIAEKILNITKQLNELTISMSSINQQYGEMKLNLDAKNEIIKELQTDNNKMNTTITDLSNRLKSLEQNMKHEN